MPLLPDDRSMRRELAIAHRSGWHTIDLETAIPNPGDSLMVPVFGEPVVVVRGDDEDIRAYRCLRRPRGAPRPVRVVVRYGMIFVNLDSCDHRPIDGVAPAAGPSVGSATKPAVAPAVAPAPSGPSVSSAPPAPPAPPSATATPRSA